MEYHMGLFKSYFHGNPDFPNSQNYISFPNMRDITERTRKMEDKMNMNITNILGKIEKLKKGRSKKYQISGYHEYKKIIKMLDDSYKYRLILDNTLKKNKVTCIKGSYYSGCCSECDGGMEYVHTKVPVMYLEVFGN